MASERRLLRTDRMLDRIVAGLLTVGALGDLFAAYQFFGEIVQLHEALRAGQDSVENLDPGTALPTVYMLGGFALGFAVLFGTVAVLILRASPLGLTALRGGVTVLLPARLLAYFAVYIRYQEYVDAMPLAARDTSYRSVIIGQVVGGGVGTFGVVAALLVLLGVALVRWFRPGTDSAADSAPTAFGSSAGAINVARTLALAGTVIALVVPLAWVRPIGGDGDLPSEWPFLATLSGVLAVGALVTAGLCILARPARLLFRWLALGVAAVIAAAEWAVTVWQAFYADVAYGSERVDGVAVAWTASIVCGLVSSALLTAVVVTLILPTATAAEAPSGVTVTRRGDGAAPERVGESGPEPAWQAVPDAEPARKRKKKKR